MIVHSMDGVRLLRLERPRHRLGTQATCSDLNGVISRSGVPKWTQNELVIFILILRVVLISDDKVTVFRGV
jgi:hypothetical protein